MLQLDNKSYKKLEVYQQHFRTAVYGLCYSGLTASKLQEIYDIVKPLGLTFKPNMGCNSCRLKFLQEVGKAWFAYDEKVKKQREESLEKARKAKAEKAEKKEQEDE